MEVKNDMRRQDRQLPHEEALRILKSENLGVMAMALENEPYCLPLNYVYYEGKIYIHSAQQGKKIDWLQKNNKVCFTVSKMLGLVKADVLCRYSAHFESVVVYGRAKIMTDLSRKRSILYAFAAGFDPDSGQIPMTDEHVERVALIEIEIDDIKGKARYS